MPLLSRLLSLWRNLFHKTRAEQQLREEVDTYLEMLIGMKIEQGIDPEEARRQALIEMGGVEQVKERVRETQIGHQLENLWKDVGYAVRSLRKHALLSIVVIATLTLGMGISTGIFTLINAGVFRPKVDHDPASYVEVFSTYSSDPLQVGRPGPTTVEDYLAFRDRARSMRDVAGWTYSSGLLGDDDAPDVRALIVTCNFFSLHNPGQPILGRLLQPADCTAANPVIVMSERLWRHRFGADPEIVGKLTHFNGQPLTVVGVTPTFSGQIGGTNIWMPFNPRTDTMQQSLNVGGRLQPGFSRREVAAELALLGIQQDRLYPGRKTTQVVTDGSYLQRPPFDSRKLWGLFLILGIIICIVLITCANVAALLLSRAAARQQEIAVRLTLGAGCIRLLRMLLVETLILAAVAGVASLYAARLPILLLFWLNNKPLDQPPDRWLQPDWRVFTYLTAISLLAGIFAGLAPALQSLKVNLVESLKGRQPLSGGARGGARLRSLLVGTQVALSLVLLVGAALFVRAYQQISTVDPGYEARQVVSMVLRPKDMRSSMKAAPGFYRTLAQSLEALPGVQSVAFTDLWPQNRISMPDFQVPGQPARQARIIQVSPAFFSTLGIPIMTGRALQESDKACSAGRRKGESCPVVVSAELARKFWPRENPLGRIMHHPMNNFLGYEVVGVARDVSTQQLGRPDAPMIYMPWEPDVSLLYLPMVSQAGSFSYSALLRFTGDGAALARAASSVTRTSAPGLRVEARTIQSYIDERLYDLRKVEMLVVILGAIPVGLAVLGIYGVVSFDVSRRTRELGIRLALGARKRDIYGAVFAASGRPVAFGLLVGLALALAGATVLAKTAVFDTINAHDPLAYMAAALLLAAVALGALLEPARRATRVDPLMALRDE